MVNMWTQAIDPDFCFWTNLAVRKIISNGVYLGMAISNRFKVTEPGTGKTAPRPKDEWIIVPDAHVPLVSESDFKKAQLILPKKKYNGEPAHIFGSKVRCPACGHAMTRYTRQNPRFKCGTAKYTDHYGCREHSVLQSDLEKTVLASIKAYAAAAVDREELMLAALSRGESEKAELAERIRTEENAVRLLEESVAKNFTALVSGKLTRDAFVSKKRVITATVTQKNAELKALRERLHDITVGKENIELGIAELRPMLTIDGLSRELVDMMIDKILVHGENDVEIVWAARFAADLGT